MRMASDPTHLMQAADLLEEAISKDPTLRDRHEPQLRLWRKGVMHVSTASFVRKKPGTTPPGQ
jgi:hypothetical protein